MVGRLGLQSFLRKRYSCFKFANTTGCFQPRFVVRSITSKHPNSSTSVDPTTMSDTENKAKAVVMASPIIDNPCWGSPDRCSLGDLLQQLDKSKAILYESKDYLVLDKPADLRMDGEYPATVHKLLTYWYPPPSLQPVKEQAKTDQEWLEQVAKYHIHSDHPDNELRPCHQLDYATSGVLVVARSKAAAGHARKCFEERKTEKAYLALVHGHIQIDATTASSWPELDASDVKERLAALEDAFRRSRQKRKADTFQGYQPPHALYQQWQQYALQKPRKKKSILTDQDWMRVWGELDKHGANKSGEAAAALNPKYGWKHVKKMKQTEPFVQAAKIYNQLVSVRMQENDEDKNNGQDKNELPVFFRIRGDEPDSFYIAAPLGEVEDDFSMRIPPSLAKLARPPLQVGSSDLVYRPSLTACQVLTRGMLQGKKVTKVRLIPRTGRRHQLRVHTSLAGHAIVGDQTYEPTDERNLYNRMCLHSQMLKIPLEASHHGDQGGEGKEEKALKIEAPDPFVMESAD